MKKLIIITLLLVFSVISNAKQQSLVPWNGEGSYTICFGNATIGYYYYQMAWARTDEELQCYANECYADFILRTR